MSASTECFKAVTNVLEEKQTLAIKLTQQSHPRTRSSYASLPPPEANDDTIEVHNAEHFVVDVGSDEESEDDRKPAAVAITYTAAQYHETKLLRLLDDVQAPHYLYQQILEWAHEAKLDKYDFTPQRKTRSSQIEHLKKWLNYDKICQPEQVKILLPGEHGHQIEVTTFNFTSQLYSLLTDKDLFGDLSNLDVDPKNSFGKYKSPKYLSTVNSGELYETAYKNMVKDREKDFLMC